MPKSSGIYVADRFIIVSFWGGTWISNSNTFLISLSIFILLLLVILNPTNSTELPLLLTKSLISESVLSLFI